MKLVKNSLKFRVSAAILLTSPFHQPSVKGIATHVLQLLWMAPVVVASNGE